MTENCRNQPKKHPNSSFYSEFRHEFWSPGPEFSLSYQGLIEILV